jgi:iron complex outermembrane recepter protein
VWIDRRVNNILPGSNLLPGGAEQQLFDSQFLPTAGISYQLNDKSKVFASAATSFRSAPNFLLVPTYNPTNGKVLPFAPVEPETGRTFELGHRFQGDMFATSISAFYGEYKNYQLSTQLADPTNPGGPTVLGTINLAGLKNWGVDAEIGLRPINHFRPYASVELLQTQIVGDTTVGALSLPTDGKQQPGSSNYQFGLGLDYDNGHMLGNMQYKYSGPQFATLMNDEQMPGFGRLDAMIGYRFSNVGYLKAPEVKLNLSNVLNTLNQTGVNGVTNNAVTTNGVSASAPSYYVGQPFSAMLTFSSAF